VLSLERSVETPALIFPILKKHLSVKKGAILLLDRNEDTFYPWAHTGYDKTTSHRLRIPGEIVRKYPELLEGDPVLMGKEELNILKPFFSIREFDLISASWICPFVFNGEVIALFMINESPLCTEKSNLIEVFKQIAFKVSPILHSSREEKFDGLDQEEPLPEKEEIYEEVSKMIEAASSSNKKILLIVFSVDSMIEEILREAPDADPFRIWRDIVRIISNMTPDNGKLLVIDKNNLLLMIAGKSVLNEKLLLHQINTAMKDYFHLKGTLPVVQPAVRMYPDDGEDSTELLEGIIPESK